MNLLFARDLGPFLPGGQLFGIFGQEQNAGTPKAGIDAGIVLHILPQTQRLARQRDFGARAALLAAPAPIPARLLRADMPLLDQRDGVSLLRQMIGRRDADDPAADDDDIGLRRQAFVAGDTAERRGHEILLKMSLAETPRGTARHGMFMRGSSASRSPSPTKLKLVTASVMATPGADREPGRAGQIDLRVVEHVAPARGRRLDAVAEEADIGLEQDRVGDVQRGRDHDRRDGVRHQLAEHDPQVRRTERDRGDREIALAQRTDLRFHDAGDAHPGRRGDEQGGGDETRLGERRERQQQKDRREAKHASTKRISTAPSTPP